MNTSILIVSHRKDLQWLEWCLKSINRFAREFHEVVVVVPVPQMQHFSSLCRSAGARLVGRFEMPEPHNQLNHQIHKCRADQVCQDADFILHVDSDCVFRESVTPADYLVDGNPVLLIEEWARVGPAICWKAGVDKALGIDSDYETMRRHPAIHHRGTYGDVRASVERVNKTDFDRYVLMQKPDYPQGFSEFNTIGNYVVRHFSKCYHLIDVGKEPYPRSKLVQFWSHAPPDRLQDVWLDGKQIQLVPIDYVKGKLGL